MRADISDSRLFNIIGIYAIVSSAIFGIQNFQLKNDLDLERQEHTILASNYQKSLNSIDFLENELSRNKFAAAEIECLAKNIYFEAGNQSYEGKLAVAQVTKNRVNNDKYPKTYCEVVFQSKENKCQFSWTCDGKSDRPRNEVMYNDSRRIAEDVYYNRIQSNKIKNDVLYYHANYVNPIWNRGMQLTANIGNHQFYTTHGN